MASRTIQPDIINPKVAKLLGLDFTGDLDRGDYISVLREYMISSRMNILGGSSKYKTKDVESVTNEYKKVKNTKKETKFTLKRTIVNKDSFLDKKKENNNKKELKTKIIPNNKILSTDKGSSLKTQNLLQPSSIEPDKLISDKNKNKKQTIDHFQIIIEKLDSIIGTLNATNKLRKKQNEKNRKNIQNEKRNERESELEKGAFKGLGNTVDKVLAPVKSLWDKIWNFITTVFLGRVVFKFFKWAENPENQGKLDAIGAFLKNTWPALLAAFLVFGSGLGSFVTGLISMVAGFIPKLAGITKSLLLFVKSHPLLFGAAAAGLALYGVGKMLGKDKVVENETERANTSRKGLEEADSTKDMTPGDREALVQGTRLKDAGGYGSLNDAKNPFQVELNQGGMVPGSGPNKDTVPSMLSPGEFVMSRGAVQAYGSETLSSMNAIGGGTNKPVIKNGITYAKRGGMIESPDKPNQENKRLLKERSEGNKNVKSGGNWFTNMFRTGSSSLMSPMNEKSKKKNDAHGYGAILDLIGKRESDSDGGFNAVNQIGTDGGHGTEGFSGDFRKMEQHGGKALTEMTVGDIMKLQEKEGISNQEWIDKGKLHAVGRYQIIGPTLRNLVNNGHANIGDKFTPGLQNKLAIQLIKNRGNDPYELQKEWIGLTHESPSTIAAALSKGGDKTSGGHNMGGGWNTNKKKESSKMENLMKIFMESAFGTGSMTSNKKKRRASSLANLGNSYKSEEKEAFDAALAFQQNKSNIPPPRKTNRRGRVISNTTNSNPSITNTPTTSGTNIKHPAPNPGMHDQFMRAIIYGVGG